MKPIPFVVLTLTFTVLMVAGALPVVQQDQSLTLEQRVARLEAAVFGESTLTREDVIANAGPTDTSAIALSQPIVTSEDGQVIENVRIVLTDTTKDAITVKHKGVVIRNFEIVGGRFGVRLYVDGEATIEHGSIYECRAVGVSADYGDGRSGSYTLRHVEIALCRDGIRFTDNCHWEYNYIHSLKAWSPGAHLDCVQTLGADGWSAKGNVLACFTVTGDTGNGCYQLRSAPRLGRGIIANGTIDGDWLSGGGYSLRLHVDEGTVVENLKVRNVVFEGGYKYGHRFIEIPITEWSNNIDKEGNPVTER